MNNSVQTTGNASKSKRPHDSAFKQQKLPAWQPILTAGTVLPTFFVIGVAFIPIGVGMLWFSNSVNEHLLDYTFCKNDNGESCSSIVSNSSDVGLGCLCSPLSFELKENWTGPVFMYYGLNNFYQNHRRYIKSRDDGQLLGSLSQTPSSDCAPFDKNENNVAIVPCGAIANSLFNDEIKLSYMDQNNVKIPVDLLRTGIAWDSDKHYKFRNPTHETGKLKEAFDGFAKPRDWHLNLWELDLENEDNNGLQNEDLIVWMRTAALPNFRKLYRRVNHTGGSLFEDGLPKGTYVLDIHYRFRVTQFSGSKSIILSTSSILGGKNAFLGISYISVGCVCLCIGVLFLFIHIKCGKQTSEMMSINPTTSYS